MKKLLSAISILILLPMLAHADALKSLDRDLRKSHLDRYERAGARISVYLRKQFIKQTESDDEISFAEKFDLAYQDKIKPGALENISLELTSQSGFFIQDIHRALDLRQKYSAAFRKDPEVRRKIQNVLIGSLHLIDVQIRTELDVTVDELLRVRQFLLSQGTFITRGTSKMTVDDIWWDWMWLRGHNYPSDLVQLHLQKLALISKQSSMVWKERIRRASVGIAIFALKNNTQPVLGHEKPAVVSLNLTNTAIQLAGDTASPEAQRQLKLYLYKSLQSTGQTYEASQIKKDIAMDLFLAKGRQIAWSSAEPWSREDFNLFQKIWFSVGHFIRGIIVFLTYGAGFVFVATPIETLLVLGAIIILAKQGESHFNRPARSLKAVWSHHKIFTKGGWRRLPELAMAIVQFIKESLGLAWHMFVASYTAAPVPFYSKVAASLLLFGIGLYFNSARSLVEGVVAQMTM